MKDAHYFDWKPVVRSLLRHLRTQDLLPCAVHDGESRTVLDADTEDERQEQAVEIVTSMDASRLSCRWCPPEGSVLAANFFLVLGNEPWETVADYAWTQGTDALSERIEVALEAFEQEWEGRPCPTTQGKPEHDEPWTETERAAYNGLPSVDYHNPF